MKMDRNGASCFSLLCFSFILVLIQPAANPENKDPRCNNTSCGHPQSPPIRFPFRLSSQPETCGSPGFVLSCSEANETLMNLSIQHQPSIQLIVKHIDYLQQRISLADPRNCFAKYALNLNALTQTILPFQFFFQSINYDDPCHYDDRWGQNFTIFQCPYPNPNRNHWSWNLSCLNQTEPPYVLVMSSSGKIMDEPLIGCTKKEDVELPSSFFYSALLNLTWKHPCFKYNQIQTHNTGNWVAQRCVFKYKKIHRIVHKRQRHSTLVLLFCCVFSGHNSFEFQTVSVLWPLLGSILGLFLLLLLLVALRFCGAAKRKKAAQARINQFLEDYRALNPARYSYADLRRITDEFKEKLGQGAYGSVFKGKLSEDIFVAVKMLANTVGDGDAFVNEVGTIGRIRHVNVVRLVGFCADGFRRALVYEFLPNDSLEKFIYYGEESQRFFNWEKLEEIALGIARGIEYLHQGCDRRILHFDIKPHNVLLDENFNPKISDFGLAKLCSMEASAVSVTMARGTMGYIAPEVFSRNFGKVSYKSDVYSFGMLVLEMVGGRRNRDEKEEMETFFPRWVYKHLEQGEQLSMGTEDVEDDKVATKLTVVGLRCIQWHPDDRPSMNLVVQMIQGNEEVELPANPFPSADHEVNGKMSRRPLNLQLEAITEDSETV